MSNMSSATVITLDRSRRVSRAMAARRRLHDIRPDRRGAERSRGRAWLNGSELGGTRAAFAHLSDSYD
jgi:hypothetical protein